MFRNVVFGLFTSFFLVSCTDTAATYREAMELKKLKPSFTYHERDDISGRHGEFDIEYSGYLDADGDLRRILVRAAKADTTSIDDHFYTNEKPLYYTHTVVVSGDTATSCTYFFHHGKCIKRACAFGEYEEEESAEKAMEFAYRTIKDFTR